jgi:hypothetical protein
LVRDGALDDKRKGCPRFSKLAEFLESIPSVCPHDLFTREEVPKARASQARLEFVDSSSLVVNLKDKAPALAIPAVVADLPLPPTSQSRACPVLSL